MQKELVSVIIPCFNGEKFLNDCFNALLHQTYKNIQVIIVNDGSTDKSEVIIDKYVSIFKENSMELIKINQKNSGQAEAINKALKVVRGEYLVWQDCDDYYEEDAIFNMLNYLKENKNIDFLRGEVVFRDENNLQKILYIGKSKNPENLNIFDDYIFETDSYCYAGIFMSRMDYFKKCIPRNQIYNSRAGQNWQLILPLAYNGKCGYLNKIVYNCRVVGNSHSHIPITFHENLKKCDAHKDILFNVIGSINMPNNIKKRYKAKIRLKYLKRKIKIILGKVKSILKKVLCWK